MTPPTPSTPSTRAATSRRSRQGDNDSRNSSSRRDPRSTPIPTPPPEPEARGVIALIRDLQAGRVRGANLEVDERRRCVEHLTAEGYSTPEIAEVLGVAERTIARDRAAVRQANRLEADEDFPAQVAGQLVRHAEIAIGRLRRIARERETAAATRVEAEKAAWQVGRELVQSLQRLGYLPETPHTVRGELEVSAAGTLTDLDHELVRVEGIVAGEAGTSQQTRARLEELRSVVERLRVGEELRALAAGSQAAVVVADDGGGGAAGGDDE